MDLLSINIIYKLYLLLGAIQERILEKRKIAFSYSRSIVFLDFNFQLVQKEQN